ncbi:MAG TPA: helix-turn-helix transcriptional regulator [Candidatus Polarisedimenticolia bacterium]|nr:helix-turn-helix transcriptional regulator [Candidatus Polarisedimenticolia bacterium]
MTLSKRGKGGAGAAAAPLGMLEEQVMLAVVRTQGRAYGMTVRRELEMVTGRSVAIGSVYVTLDRLEAKGLVASRRASGSGGDAGGSRRVFSVTSAGARALADTRAMRRRLWQGIEIGSLLKA